MTAGLPLVGAILSCDVVGFSNRPLHSQAAVTGAFCRMAEDSFARTVGKVRARFICTGDGFTVVVPERERAPGLEVKLPEFVQALHRECGLYNEQWPRPERFVFRAGLHFGPFHFVQLFEGKNAIGDGINTAARLTALGDAFHVLLSATFKERLEQKGARLTVQRLAGGGEARRAAGGVWSAEIGAQRVPRKLRASSLGSRMQEPVGEPK